MKVTFNLSFLLCISSVMMPIVDARANGVGLHKRSTALKSLATKRSIKHDVKAYDLAAHQQRRSLQTKNDDISCESFLATLDTNPCTCDDQDEFDATAECSDFLSGLDLVVVCEFALTALGPNPCTCDDQGEVDTSTAECSEFVSGLDAGSCEDFLEALGPNPCTCDDQGEVDTSTAECSEFVASCNICDTLQGEETCFTFEEEVSNDGSSDEVETFCYTYISGVFDNTICEIENFTADTCTITIDGTECNSCATLPFCDGDGYDIDCSNVIEGEKYNTCTDDIPETSRFLATANNDRFVDDIECGVTVPSTTSSPITVTQSPTSSPTTVSGAFALSFHAVSAVGLMVFATFW
jgi:hypothetical protein